MRTPLPNMRTVDALTGEKAPTAFFKALSEADEFCAEVKESRDLHAELDRLTRDNEMLRRQNDALHCRLDELTEGGGLEHHLAEVCDQLLAAKACIERVRSERDSWREAALAAGVTA